MKAKKDISERQVLVGHRMKLAAELAGLGKVTLTAEAMGVTPGAVSRWWTGKQRPKNEVMEHYANVMGKPVLWFHMNGSDEAFDVIADALAQIVDASMTGSSLPDAHSRVTGETDRFGRRERERLAAGTNALLDRINQETAGRWNDLDSRQKREVMGRLRSEAERRRG